MQVDINNDYHVLPPSWQDENKNAAIGTMGLIVANPDRPDQDLFSDVHEQWLDRNSWAKDGELGVARGTEGGTLPSCRHPLSWCCRVCVPGPSQACHSRSFRLSSRPRTCRRSWSASTCSRSTYRTDPGFPMCWVASHRVGCICRQTKGRVVVLSGRALVGLPRARPASPRCAKRRPCLQRLPRLRWL